MQGKQQIIPKLYYQVSLNGLVSADNFYRKLDQSLDLQFLYMAYDAMHQKIEQHKAYHRKLVKRRSSTVEPVLGTLINHLGMRRVYARGMAAANKHVLMAALCYNLKKLMKFSRKKVEIIAQQLPNNCPTPQKCYLSSKTHCVGLIYLRSKALKTKESTPKNHKRPLGRRRL